MANLRKKVINKWNDGITTLKRDSNPETSTGAQMVKHFDVYRIPNRLSPMSSWTDFTTEAEQEYGIRAMGGIDNIVYGAGKALTNWYGSDWGYRVRVDINAGLFLKPLYPLWIDLANMPAGFWSNVNSDAGDVRVTDKNGESFPAYVSDIDTTAQTGNLWIDRSIIPLTTPTFTDLGGSTAGNADSDITNVTTNYAFAFPIELNNTTWNYLTISAKRTGTPDDLKLALYDDDGGEPGTLVDDMAVIPKEQVPSNDFHDVRAYCGDQTYTGTYWIVCTTDSADASNYYEVEYTSSGSETVYMGDSGLTWTSVDTSATSSYKIEYADITTEDLYFYIYYGNSDVNEIQFGDDINTYANGGKGVFDDLTYAYTWGDEVISNMTTVASTSTALETSFEDLPSNFLTGLAGGAIKTLNGAIQTDSDDNVGIADTEATVTLLYKPYNFATNVQIWNDSSDFIVTVKNNGTVSLTVDIDGGQNEEVSTTTLNLNEWNVIDVQYNSTDGYNIFINNNKNALASENGPIDFNPTGRFITANSGDGELGAVFAEEDTSTSIELESKFNTFIQNARTFVIGSEEAIASVDLQYDGLQIYQKDVTSGDWVQTVINEQPARSLSYYPVNGFVEKSGNDIYFMCSDLPENRGGIFLGKTDLFNVIEPEHLTLFSVDVQSLQELYRSAPTLESASGNNTSYFTYYSVDIAELGDPGVADVRTFAGGAQSLESWRTYLAVAYSRRNRAIIDVWDLSTTNIERVDSGTGNMRIVGTANGTLFGVVDNFIDDAIKSNNKPTFEVHRYVGNGKTIPEIIIEVPAIVTDYDDLWERAVSNFKLKRNGQTLFYARIPNNEAGTTFDEGFWAVGLSDNNRLSLTLQVDTSGLDMPEQVHGFAQQVFFIKKDGSIKRLSDSTYENLSLFTSRKMNEGNTEIEKKLHGIEIITEPLTSGQTVSVYYRIQGQTVRTKICEFTGEGEIAYETTYDINGSALPNYQEIEFDIESTGGSSDILELNYRYEYLSDVV